MDGWKVIEEKRFLIPSLPPSCNAIYQIIFSQRRVEMKPEVRAWKNGAKLYVPKITPLDDSYLFRLDATFSYNFFFLNGKIRKFDTHNMMKVLCDAVAEKAGFRDELVKFGSWHSIHNTEKEQVEIVVSQIKPEP